MLGVVCSVCTLGNRLCLKLGFIMLTTHIFTFFFCGLTAKHWGKKKKKKKRQADPFMNKLTGKRGWLRSPLPIDVEASFFWTSKRDWFIATYRSSGNNWLQHHIQFQFMLLLDPKASTLDLSWCEFFTASAVLMQCHCFWSFWHKKN